MEPKSRRASPARGLLLDEELLPQLGQRPGEQPGHVHLRDADLLRDLRLRHVPEEPEQQDALLPGRQILQQRLERLAVLDALQGFVVRAERVRDRRGLVVRVGDVQGQRGVGVGRLQALQDLLLGDAQFLGQLMDRGERPCRWESSAVAVVSDSRSSWSRRGTRTAQPLSRKCRLISPTTVGVAYVENSTPRSGSKRSTDLMRPMVATWVRSSSGSPRLRKRRARCSTSGRCMRTSRLRSSAYSTLPSLRVRSSMKSARAPLRSWGRAV